MSEREKKIAEIREALEKATPWPWKLVMDSYDDEKDTHFPWMIINADDEEICDFSGGGDVKLENAHIMTNAPEWLRFLLSELERLEREYAEERAAHNAHVAELLEKEQERNMYKASSEVFYDRLQGAYEERNRLFERLKVIKTLLGGVTFTDGRQWSAYNALCDIVEDIEKELSK